MFRHRHRAVVAMAMAGLMNGKEVLLLYVIFSVETYQKNNDGRPAEDSGRLAVLNKQQRF